MNTEAWRKHLRDLAELVEAAQAWREFQHPDSQLDQRSDLRLRGDAEFARQSLLTAIDALENTYD